VVPVLASVIPRIGQDRPVERDEQNVDVDNVGHGSQGAPNISGSVDQSIASVHQRMGSEMPSSRAPSSWRCFITQLGNFIFSNQLAKAIVSSACVTLVAAIIAAPWQRGAAAPRAADAPLQSERRVALVIGNANYKRSGISLSNPRNDAQDIAAVLAAIGFEVVTAIDTSKRDMDFVLQRFARLATDADAALFFYAGHAMQFQGRNFLMPIDAELEDEISVRYQMVGLEEVRAALDQANGIKIMILDACRNNPLANRLNQTIAASRSVAATRGLARIDKTEGMVLAYATAPDDVAQDGHGRNSPFTAALLKRLQEPGLEIGMMFRRVASDVNAQTGGRQRPETYISLLSDYYLNQSDSIAWDRLKDQDDVTALRDFLSKYPSSPRANFARSRLEALERFAKEREDASRRAREDEQRKAAEAEEQRVAREAAARREAEERLRAEQLAAQRRIEEEQKRQEAVRVEAARQEAQRQEAQPQLLAEQKRQEALREQEEEKKRIAALRLREEQERNKALRQQRRTDPFSSQQAPRPLAPVTDLSEPKPWEVVRDCPHCPELVVVSAGEFVMGSSKEDIDSGRGATNEGPQHRVFIKRPVAVGRFEVTRDQFETFVSASGYKIGDRCYTLESNTPRERADRSFRNPGYAQSGVHPAVCVNWRDAKAYVEWLSQSTGKTYRLLSEAEWEYVARAGSTLPYGFGKDATEVCKFGNGADQSAKLAMLPTDYAYMNCTDNYPYSAPVGSFKANAMGLFDLLGNVWEWTEDCFYDDYLTAPSDGSARAGAGCQARAVRGGSWFSTGKSLRPAVRAKATDNARYDDVGFRVARVLVP
jgi:formylglycine-generating enzyme required for sulfatase activity